MDPNYIFDSVNFFVGKIFSYNNKELINTVLKTFFKNESFFQIYTLFCTEKLKQHMFMRWLKTYVCDNGTLERWYFKAKKLNIG